MFLLNLLIVFILNHGCVHGFGYFDMGNVFHHLNKEVDELVTFQALASPSWIEQELDHFNKDEKRTFNVKYFEKLDFWKRNGPIYLFIGGESALSPAWSGTGIAYELAKETNGVLILAEHRYYGASKPFNDTDPESYKFLSAKQALADLEKLLKFKKQQPEFNNSKVVVIGGSYAGNLAAWMKVLYPELVDAAIASSGPVLAKKNFYEYIEKVNDNYMMYGTPDCIPEIRKIFQRYDELLKTPTGQHLLKKEENICEECDLMLPANQQVFFMSKIDKFMSESQYGDVDSIAYHCKHLNDTQYNTADLTTTRFWNKRNKCLDYDFQKMIEEFREEENDWILAWVYQTCTEFGYYQTTNSDQHPFTDNVPLEFYINTCISLFGSKFNERRVDEGIKEVNELFGGLKPNVTNVVFANGDMDPWSTLSVLEDLSYETPAVVIPRSSHCRDLFSDGVGDFEELKQARKHIKYLIKNWIGAGDY